MKKLESVEKLNYLHDIDILDKQSVKNAFEQLVNMDINSWIM